MGANSIDAEARNSLSISDKSPPFPPGVGIIPSFTPTKNKILTSFNRVLFISPTTIASTFCGIVPTCISSNPATKTSSKSFQEIGSAPNSSTICSNKCITSLYICRYSLAFSNLPSASKKSALFPSCSSIFVLVKNS